MMRFFVLCAFLCACATAATRAEIDYNKTKPKWLDAEIFEQDGFIIVAGRSIRPLAEQEARDGALANATMQFVRYAGVQVEAFDRAVETYNDKAGTAVDIESRNTVRARAFVQNAKAKQWDVQRFGDGFIAAVQLAVPKAELERIQKEKNVKLSLDIGLYRAGKDGALDAIGDGDVLVSGEAYALFVKPSDGCFLYVYQTDGSGETFRLFPNAEMKTATNPLRAGDGMWVPNADNMLVLDQTTGKERLLVVASLERVPELEAATKLEAPKVEQLIKTMGVAGTTAKVLPASAPPVKNKIADIKKKLTNEDGAFVYETWFWHR